MESPREILFSDLVEASAARAPHFAELVARFLAQPDPAPNAPEVPPEEPDQAPPVPPDAWNLPKLRRAVAPSTLERKTATERKLIRREAFEGTAAGPNPPPRLRLADLLLDLYEAGDEPAHSALLDIYASAPLTWGVWKAMKRTMKLAEARFDAAMFGVLAHRFDTSVAGERGGEVSIGTLVYLKRRAWRFLRRLGRILPELYPSFAAEVLRHYTPGFAFSRSWVANQIWGHAELVGRGHNHLRGAPPKLEKRYLDEAWKKALAPTMFLLESCQHDEVAGFAIRSLERDFPETLSKAEPERLARLGARPLAPVQEFVVKLLSVSPELHMSKLEGLKLRDMVLGLLTSGSAAARKYALEYARGYAPNLGKEELAALLSADDADVRALAVSRLSAMDPKALGLPLLVAMLRSAAGASFASKMIVESFTPAELDPESYLALMTGTQVHRKLVQELFTKHKSKAPAALLQSLIDDPRCPGWVRGPAMQELSQYSGAEIGFAWIKKALLQPVTRPTVETWLRGGKFKAPVLDVEWMKGLVQKPIFRELALTVLVGSDWVPRESLGLPWLLEMVRHADPTVQTFARQYVLHQFGPAEIGLERLWALATDKKEAEATRRFAGELLAAHHPGLATEKKAGVEPKLDHAAFSKARLGPLFASELVDVRELAAKLAYEELVRWGDAEILYTLAESPHKEPRKLAERLLLSIQDGAADPAHTPPAEWLDSARVFALAESAHKSTRELAVSLIRRHYTRIGGAQKLLWLMEGPDREVRLFAVRLLWEKHRPHPPPPGFRPKKLKGAAAPEASQGPLSGAEDALQRFLKTTLLGLPPGRMERRDADALADRALPASVAKARLIEVVRDMAIEDAAFAALVSPVLSEMSHSAAMGEWQSSVAALARIRRAHPGV
ncbi:MAG: hypothetical protein U1E65_02105 [Myxococcota bacterium]